MKYFLILLLSQWVWADETQLVLSRQVNEWTVILDNADKALIKADLSEDALEKIRSDVASLRLNAIEAADAAIPQTKQINDELSTLGPAPSGPAARESPAVSQKRKLILAELTALDGSIKEAELIIARADKVLSQTSSLRRIHFAERVLTRGQSPILPSVWTKALSEIASDWSLAGLNFMRFESSDAFQEKSQTVWRQLAFTLILAFATVWPLSLWLQHRFGYSALPGGPSHGQRLRTAFFIGFVRVLLPSIATFGIYLSLIDSGLLSDAALNLAKIMVGASIFFYFATAFCKAALAPGAPSWRIVKVDDTDARIIYRVMTALIGVFALDKVLDELSDLFEASLELILFHKFIAGLIIAALLLVLLRQTVWRAGIWQHLRYFLGVLVCAIPLSALLGYVALSMVLATQLVLTAGLYVAVNLLRDIVAEAIKYLFSQSSTLGLKICASLSLSDEDADILRFWLSELFSVLIFFMGFLGLLLLWGAGGADLISWLYNAFFGFKIGSINISFADILFALLLFVLLLMCTRLLQSTLDHRIFPKTRLDFGVRHSVRSGLGYLGFILALTVAVSTVGINLSNLAMIAGALSVGIGFGLQNIVNNFVSGLILLIERPIKVGDWVVVGDYQGTVKKISVRATEISTPDQASVFIPNSNLIAAPVMNRTYADKIGRMILPIGLAYGADAKKARDLLLEIAHAHQEVRLQPEPYVLFKAFGESALNFELVAYVSDVEKAKAVSSELCFEIDAVFREQGISMPFPQRDVNLGLREDQLQRLVDVLAER